MNVKQQGDFQALARNTARMLNATAALVQNGQCPNDGVVMTRLLAAAGALEQMHKAIYVNTSDRDRKTAEKQVTDASLMIWQMAEQHYDEEPETQKAKALKRLRELTNDLVANANSVQHYDEEWTLEDVKDALVSISEDADEAVLAMEDAQCSEDGLAKAYDGEYGGSAKPKAKA